MHPISHNLFAVRFRLNYLRRLQKKAKRALVLIDLNIPEGELKDNTYFTWVYTSSFIRCVLGKWVEVTREEYQNVAYLHDKCLMKALINNIQTSRTAISSLSNGEALVEEWDVLWAGFDD